MSRTLPALSLLAAGALLALAAPSFAGSGVVTQTFELRPGWNAVFLQVQPEPRDPASVFRDLPVESVWAWIDRRSPVQFIQDPSEEPWGQPGWSVYYKSEPKAFLTNLHAVFAGWAYLVSFAGTKAQSWQVAGVPSAQSTQWVADSFNLAGFPLDPAASVTFADLLGPSPAHAGQPVYRMGKDGKWQLIADHAAAAARNGEAYWVYCKGTSSYQGPVELTLPFGSRLDYGAVLTELTVTLSNQSGTARAVTLTLSSTDVVLAYRRYNTATSYFEWLPLSGMGPVQVDAGRQVNLRLAVRREQMGPGLREAVLEIGDGAGSRFLVPVSAEKVGG